jgi:UDP-N-acetylmuramate dehydrogenase
MRGEMRFQEPLSKHTTWRIGGKADRFFIPADVFDLANFLKENPHESLFWLGLGSNLLIRDGGIRGTVISTEKLNHLEQIEETLWKADAGVSCAKLARQTARAGLGGGEFLAGIPGSLGGALAMNAGAFGGETWNLVELIIMLNRDGELIERQPSEFIVNYRHVIKPFENEWFASAILRFDLNNENSIKIKALLEQRKNTQPIGLPSCGSVFRNPKPLFAAKLIEDAGLKGFQIGGAQVSEKHSNFIINVGNATAKDVEELIALIISKVEEKFAVRLQPEVHIVGEFENDRP